MKKITYLSALALGFALVACDDYKEPNPPAQMNPFPGVLEVSNVVVAPQVSTSTTFDLQDLNNQGQNILLATVTAGDFPMGYTVGAQGEISVNDFQKAVEVPLIVTENTTKADALFDVYVAPDALEGAYQSITASPDEATIALRFLLTAEKGTEVAVVGGPTNYYMTNFTIIPFPSAMVIEDAYYLIGTIDDWSVVGAIKFNHSDMSVYDDPVFTIKIDISEADAANGWWWKIIPQSTYDLGDWGDADYSQFGPAENGSPDASGALMPRLNGEDPGAGNFQESGQWLLTINMAELTYEFSSAVENLWTPGDANGWSAPASQMLYTNNYANYFGYAVLSPGGFKFTSGPDWDHTNYGAGEAEGELSDDGGAGNLSVAEKGLYWCAVNIPSLTYEVTLINTIGVIGDATPNGWDASTALTPSDDFLTWSGEITFGSGEFKFRANDGWDINLGGTPENLTQDGANIPSPGEGTYMVTLNLSQLPYSCQLVKK